MRRFCLALIMIVAWAIPAASQDPEAPGDAARGVIAEQIEAFRADDFAAAFAHASPAIRGIFGDPQRFGQMVRQGYPMVYRPVETRFLGSEATAQGLVQRMMVTDGAGAVHILEYDMVEANGVWQINGVSLLDAAETGA